MTPRGFHPLRVATVDRLCADAVAVTFDVPPELAERYRFRPGQSVTVHRDGERRTYSICAPAGGAPRIGVREVPGGLVSPWIVHRLRAGDLVEVAPPAGTFTPEPATGGRHVLIAAGSGITPVLSIAASLLRQAGTEVTLLYGNRRADTVMFAEELADLKDTYPGRLELVHVLSREPRESELFSGRLDAGRLRQMLRLLIDVPAVGHWWLCGPYGMVVDATAVLTEFGVPGSRVHRELFWVDEAPPPPVRPAESLGPSCDVTVVLDGRKTSVAVPDGVTLLDGAQRARPDLPFACKGGVCGTCRARVTDGTVVMRRNFALEDGEVTAGFVLTCQSLPTSPKVVIDFDQ
ncbi:1,2-phenylacetyl-CoA epoxidase subunit PaaE [Actinoplanes derwentensis]|uniref:Ring-1,2-phenylacetyl-CoA epoxidase subunit PaaE n=1 Tax=Actinoplanes derwentensis TaxID=113562 RepID=A0A1H1ZKM3_9ACTN|nr:1,2-phenylacetyl-CoA epoxidase subunit PaaE [Actinoplanes derwentensis]GID82490.1 phenylacetic acid degradation protein [Actinoplanes derwentensis]SDT34224.1 ring-1,2-phenylacetyl-CoA epoxidase subunit PaaE [Actinoplanes derwentensis]